MRKNQGVFRQFARYVSLNVLSMVGLSCYILADTYFISAGVGSDGIEMCIRDSPERARTAVSAGLKARLRRYVEKKTPVS